MSATPEDLAFAEDAVDAAAVVFAEKVKARNELSRAISKAAYDAGGTSRQFDCITRVGPERFHKSLIRRLRTLGLTELLTHARVR